MKNKGMQRLTYGFGISMAILMVASLFLPAITQNTVQNQQLDPPTLTPVPVPTFPPPLTDFSRISFDEEYLHPSGLFSVGIPTGWIPNQPITNSAQAQITMSNPDTVSVIETYITSAIEPIESTEQLSARFDAASLRASWSQYTTSNELARRVEGDRLLIDFELSRNQQQFLGRHVARAEGDWIYVVRVVVPANARELMFHMLDAVIENFRPNTQFAGTPLAWQGYYDTSNQHILRYPNSWNLVDGGNGRPASFVSADGTALRVETTSQAITDEASARAWVEGLRSGIEARSVQPITREGGVGFAVSYTYTDPDGEQLSGKVVLLNGEDGQLHTANALLPVGGVDLNNEDDQAVFFELTTALETFSLLTGLNLPQPEAPEPEPEATDDNGDAESTPEAEEADGNGDAESTPEADDNGDAESTPEAEETDDE